MTDETLSGRVVFGIGVVVDGLEAPELFKPEDVALTVWASDKDFPRGYGYTGKLSEAAVRYLKTVGHAPTKIIVNVNYSLVDNPAPEGVELVRVEKNKLSSDTLALFAE